MSSTYDHVVNAHKHNEETLEVIYRGIDYFQGGQDVEELRESDPDLLKDLESLGFDPDSTYPDDDLLETAHDYAVSVEVDKVVTIWLTLGGPNIYLEVRLRGDLVMEVRHFAAWGSDRRETTVREDSALWEYAERMAELAILD